MTQIRKRRWLAGALGVLASLLLALPLFADSQARIVRLSSIQGEVKIDRHTGDGFEPAIQNMPITEGVRLTTQQDGRAEVEFEDGSTMRLIPDSTVEFTRLSLRDSGDRVTQIELSEGTAYFNIDLKKHEDFLIDFGHRTIDLQRSARFRVTLDRDNARVAVSQGKVEVAAPGARTAEISKNNTATFELADNDRFEVARDYQEEPYDAWDKEQDDYQKSYASNHRYDSPFSYGFSDLNYYGNYFDAPGYGQVWRPYSASYGWDPFYDGSWMWYPGFGYTWVSAYPWGWIPYRYGNWLYVPSYGWCWQPGNWRTWNPVPRVVHAPAGWTRPPVPTTGRAPVMITRGTPVPMTGPAAKFGDPTRRVIREGPDGKIMRNPDSEAGLGIPRGRVDLGKFRTPPPPQAVTGPEMHPSPKTIRDTDGEAGRRVVTGTPPAATGNSNQNAAGKTATPDVKPAGPDMRPSPKMDRDGDGVRGGRSAAPPARVPEPARPAAPAPRMSPPPAPARAPSAAPPPRSSPHRF